MKGLYFATLPALALALAVPDEVRRDAVPADKVRIVSAQTSGNGCPQGSVQSNISGDRTLITFGFDSFQAYIGPGTDVYDRTKNCEIHLSLAYPGGFQYSIIDTTYRGYARLDAGVTGSLYTTYYYSKSASKTCTSRSTISGGGSWEDGQLYTKSTAIDSATVVWSACGDSDILNINNRIALSSSDASASGELAADFSKVSIAQQVHVAWRAC